MSAEMAFAAYPLREESDFSCFDDGPATALLSAPVRGFIQVMPSVNRWTR